jgi:hypothetical protein
MIYVKCVAAGIAGAIVAPLVWIGGMIVVPTVTARIVGALLGSGGVGGAVVTSNQLLAVAAIGFVFGFTWAFRRGRRRAP